jgi:alkanesulfonate monooxygenase
MTREEHLRQVVSVARWSEGAGCSGILVYTDNSTLDPWLIAHIILQNTRSLAPLVAVQPVYLHPYTVAKTVASLGYLYGRRLYLNMVAGGFKNDLTTLNDPTPHDQRYERLIEYTTIIQNLLAGEEPLTFDGVFYKTNKLKLQPTLPPELFPGIFVSGSSEAGRDAARRLGAVAVQYPKPPAEYESSPPENLALTGIRVGVIARADAGEAWRVAHERFPADRKGQLTHQLAMKTSDSTWHKQLSDKGQADNQADQKTEVQNEKSPYWLGPFQNYQTFCPYLVGDYAEVAQELARYFVLGYSSMIVDIPPSEEELEHLRIALELAGRRTLEIAPAAGGAA